MSEYELTYVVQADVDDEKLAAIQERIAEFVSGAGGEVTRTLDWGRRRLAYPIKRQTAGIYVTHRLELAPEAVDELQRMLRFSEDVLRYLVLTTDDVPPPPPPVAPTAPSAPAEVEAAPEPAAEPEAEVDADPEAEATAEVEAEPEADAEADAEPEVEAESEADATAEAETDADTEPSQE